MDETLNGLELGTMKRNLMCLEGFFSNNMLLCVSFSIWYCVLGVFINVQL